MGSSGEGGEWWWQSSQLSPTDLRQHAESWSLAADAATATLLQSISQRLVSRTHEVEGALERVVEEADRVLTSISNTNNAFHMLANTQFIENRTYQDDADVAKREKPEPKEKVTVTEEEVLSRCRVALTDGLTLAGTCYDRHEIQDSDSDDEDSPDSPVPVYALVDPYEGRPLPLIIGSEAFLADDKVGLRDDVTSSDENSKATTLSPDETDNESGEDTRDETDRVALTPKTIPATSSRLTDDESDSDWTDEDGLAPVANPGRPQPPQLSSDEDDNDDDEDFFGPSSKAGKSIVSNNRINRTITASKNRVIDSDSDDEGGLFGKSQQQQQQQQQQQSSLFGGPQALPKSRGSSNSTGSLFGNLDGNSVAGRKDTGSVEIVRAMPNPTQSLPPASVKNHRPSSNLFASDSDDDGNLFSSKKLVAGKVRSEGSKGQDHERSTRSSGLFSSDDDAPLFTATPANGTDNNQEDERGRSEGPQPKLSVKKFQVPVGGVKLFGSDITSALRCQKSSDSEPSDDKEDDWDGSGRASSSSLHKSEPPPVNSNQSKVTKRSDNIKGGGGGGLGLFDEDDEDLFSAAVKTSSDSKTVKNKKSELDPHPPEKSKSLSKKSGETVIAKTEVTSVGKFFSDDDDDDDLFGAPKEPNLTQPQPKEETAFKVKGKSGPSTSRPANLPLPTENIQKPSQPVKIPEPPKALSTSLFSSPSDDDDLFSTPKLSQVSTKTSSAFVTDPPPIIQDSDTKKSGKLSAPLASGSQAVSTKEPSNKNVEVKTDNAVDKLQPPPANRLFSSPSDEDELFSTRSKKQDYLFTAPASKTQIGSTKEASNANGGVKTSKAGDKLQPPTTPRLFSSPSDEDELFSAVPKAPDAASINVEAKANTMGDKLRPPNTPRLFSSPSDEDELFASVPKMPNPPCTNGKVKPEDKLQPPHFSRMFSSPSDEDELFSGAPISAGVQDSQEKVPPEKSSAISQRSADTAVNATQRSDVGVKFQSSIFDSPEDDMFKSKTLTSGGKSNLFASNLDDDIDDIFSGPGSKSQPSSRALVDTKKTISNIFEGVDDDGDDDIFASTQKDTKPRKSSVHSKPSITNVSNVVSHMKSETEKPVDENKTSVDEKKQSSVPTSAEEVAPPTQPKVKKPIGGVALFGGAELANQLSKRKSMLGNDIQTKDADRDKAAPPQGSELFKPEEKDILSQNKLFKSKEETTSSKSGIFGSESDDDNLFGTSSPSPTVSHGNNPPRLSPTKDTPSTIVPSSKPKNLPSKPESVPTKPQKEPKAEEMKKGEDEKSQGRVVSNDSSVIEKSKDHSESESKEKERESRETSEVRREATTPSKKEVETIIENKEKDQETAEASREKEEVKPKKKPPIGGVSMFGGGGIGGKELLAKVQKRKSMMAPESESESDEESTITSSAYSHTSGTSLPPEERCKAGATFPSLASPVSPSPRSPPSPIPVFLPTSSSNVVCKSGGEESSVSFDDPACSTSTLESLNKTRARGSIKRRPPSRAHRKSAISNQDPSETPTSTANLDSDTTSNTISTESESITQPAAIIAQSVTTTTTTTVAAAAATPTANSEPQHISEPSKKDTHAAVIDRVDFPRVIATDSSMGVNKDPVTSKGNLNPGVTGESRKDAVKDEDSNLVTEFNSALHQSKQEPVTNTSSSTKASSSLFGGSDSDDEDLFGKKPKSQPVKTSELSVSNNVTKQTDKAANPVSLFGDDDDDDDIFSSGAKARSTPVATRQSSTSKPKTDLKTSSEPFDDPLLGNLK